MKNRRIFFGAVLFSVLVYAAFIIFSNKYFRLNEEKYVRNHARVVAESLWTFNPDLARDYLQLACEARKYEKATVSFTSKKVFIVIENELDKPVDLFFKSLSLIRAVPLETDIFHKERKIGKISVEWYSTAIYIHLYLLVIVLLLLAVLWFFLGTLKQKYDLKGRVKERTAELEKEIEERRNTEEALRESEGRFRILFEQVAVGVAQIDSRTGKFIRINKRYCDIVGYSTDEMTLLTFQELTHPDDLRPDLKNMEKLKAGTINEFSMEKRYFHKNGSVIWVKLTVSPMLKKGQELIYHVAIVEDITRQKQVEKKLLDSEYRFATHLANTPVGAISWNLDFEVVDWNPAAEKIFGYPIEEAIGRKAEDLILADGIKAEINDLFQQILAEQNGRYKTNENITKDGKTIICEWFNTTLKDFDGKIIGVASLVNDITENRRIERQLQQSQKMDAIGTLAGGIAHDFNNMLSIITGNISDVLTQMDQESEVHDILVEVQEGANQAQKLTQQLLTFSKGGEPVKKVIQLNKLIKDSAEFVIRGAKSKCEFRLAKDIWSVEADSGQLNQVISNLIINADQAMPNGGIVTIFSQNIEAGSDVDVNLSHGKYVKISIQDQGIGIQDKLIPNIFDPYFTTKQKGNGLGLATVYSIIEKHSGHITVHSEIGKGTNFHIYLPASDKNYRKDETEAVQYHSGQGKILIMDDQEPILKMAERMLNRMGYETERALDGTEAVDAYRKAFQEQKPFDVVILDLTVPGGMGGAQAIPELLKIDPNIKAIVSSGYSNDPVMSNYEDYGFCGIVAKPYTKMQLAEALDNILN